MSYLWVSCSAVGLMTPSSHTLSDCETPQQTEPAESKSAAVCLGIQSASNCLIGVAWFIGRVCITSCEEGISVLVIYE